MSDETPIEPDSVEQPIDSKKILHGWSETIIGEVPNFSSDEIYSTDSDVPDYNNIYIDLQYLKNLWVNRPSSEVISDANIALLQKKIEVATLASILRIIGFEINGPLDLDDLVEEVRDLYPGKEIRPIQTAQRGAYPGSFAMSIENAQMREIAREREANSESEELIGENKLIEGKNLIFVNSLISKGVAYGFVHFVNILRKLNKVTPSEFNRILNNNFGFASAKLEKEIYFSEISDHIIRQIIEHAKTDVKDNDNFVIVVSDDVVVNGFSIDSVIRSIISKLKEEGINQELINSCVKRIVIDSSNCYLTSCLETDNAFTWILKEHPDYGNQSYRIQINK